MKNIHFKITIPKKLVNKLSKLLFDKTKRMYLRKYPDHIFILILGIKISRRSKSKMKVICETKRKETPWSM